MIFTTDPARDAERWEEEKERMRKLAECDLCGDSTTDCCCEIACDKVCENCSGRCFEHDVRFL